MSVLLGMCAVIFFSCEGNCFLVRDVQVEGEMDASEFLD